MQQRDCLIKDVGLDVQLLSGAVVI